MKRPTNPPKGNQIVLRMTATEAEFWMPNVGISSNKQWEVQSWIAHVSRQRLIPAKTDTVDLREPDVGSVVVTHTYHAPGNCATASRQCLEHQEWECTRHHCDTEMLLRGRETQQARHSGGTGLLGEWETHQPWVPECGIRRGLIPLEAKVVSHSEWRERALFGVAGPTLIGFPPPPHVGTHGMSNVDSNNATCNAWNCTPDERSEQERKRHKASTGRW